MKNLSLILNAVLFAAVIFLYLFVFVIDSDEKSGTKTVRVANDSTLAAIAERGIVYINIDSVLNNYDMYFDIQADLQEKLKTSDAQLTSQQQKLQKEMEDFQYKIDRGLVTRAEAGELQQQLAQKEQALYQLQQNLQMQLAEEEAVAQRKVLNSIMEYLEKLEKSGIYQYQFVLGTTFGGNILYANEEMNITDVVSEGLNEEYRNAKEK